MIWISITVHGVNPSMEHHYVSLLIIRVYGTFEGLCFSGISESLCCQALHCCLVQDTGALIVAEHISLSLVLIKSTYNKMS